MSGLAARSRSLSAAKGEQRRRNNSHKLPLFPLPITGVYTTDSYGAPSFWMTNVRRISLFTAVNGDSRPRDS